jgi:alpha-ribazole phosphatase
MLHLLLVRHGETEWNKQRRYQGQADIPLSSLGMQQAALVAERLAKEEIDAIYASDLKRAWQTAMLIAEQKSLSLYPEPRLREMNFGVLEGLTWDEAEKKYPKMLKAWLKDYNQPPEGGEAMDVFSARVLSLRDDLLKKHNDQKILLVAHGGSLSELLRLTIDVPPERRWAFSMDNASISELLLGDDDYPLLKQLNDTCHLKSLKI